MSEPRPLHRLFELSRLDFFEGTDVEVEAEMDLSLRKQLLDLVIIRRGSTALPRSLPDGFEVLAPHNLVSFKSHQEALDSWAVCELIGHYVNYRKQSAPAPNDLQSEDDFQLFAVCARFPRDLARQVALTVVQDGVYELQMAAKRVRIVVISQLPQEQQNAMLLLFSAREELLRYGRDHYRPHSAETSTLLYQLIQIYAEDPTMSQKLQEFVRQTIAEMLASLSPEERLKGLPAEELRKYLPPEERLKGLSVEDVLRGLDPATLKALKDHLKANGNGSKPQ